MKLQEVDEAIDPIDGKCSRDDPFELADLLSGNVSNEQLLQVYSEIFNPLIRSAVYKFYIDIRGKN